MSDLTEGELGLIDEVFGSVSITEVTQLTGSQRTVVSRVRFADLAGVAGSVIVKRFVERGANSVREPATLRLLRAHGVPGVARLLAESTTEPALLLQDLGDHPTLADLLLGSDPVAARNAVLGWAKTLGRLHSATTGLGGELTRELAHSGGLGPPAIDEMPSALAAGPAELGPRLGMLGVSWTAEAAAELDVIGQLMDVSEPGSAGAITPADTCPDNAIATGDGVVLLDFEGGQYRHVAWDAAYLLLPWPSCWCAWRLSTDLATEAYATWEQEVAGGMPSVKSEEFQRALEAARIGWAFVTLGWFLRSALERDLGMHPDRPEGATPGRRSVLQHRMAGVTGLKGSQFPALRGVAEQALHAMEREWEPRRSR